LSGIRHYQGDEDLSVRRYPSLTAALAIFQDDSLLHAPGAQLTYSTYGYTLLGVAVEGASGMSFMSYLRSNVFAPLRILAMRDDPVSEIVPHRVRGYARDSSGVVHNAAFMNSSYKIPGGGLVSTAGDLARFGAALQSGQLVRPESFTQMATPVRTTDGKLQPYGYGLIIGTLPNLRNGVVWHGGVQQGVTTMLFLYPQTGIVVTALANLEGIGSSLAMSTNEVLNLVADTVAP
jgi:CubicO group peptidase (beta-lactamase class C family)